MSNQSTIHSKHLWIHSNTLSYAIRSPIPIHDGHTIIYPKDATCSFSTMTQDIREGMWQLSQIIVEQLQHLEPLRCHIYFDIPKKDEQNTAVATLHVVPIFSEGTIYEQLQPPQDFVHDSIEPQHNEHTPLPLNIQQDYLPILVTGGKKQPFFPILKKLFQESKQIDLILAFVQDSGLRLLQPTILTSLQKGSHIRICTGDYLHITQAEALYRIRDWQHQARLAKWSGNLEVHIYEHEKHNRSFHPKGWIFYQRNALFDNHPNKATLDDVAYIGSSNFSFTALCLGVEWNLLARRSEQPQTFERLKHDFDEIWKNSTILDESWLQDYEIRSKNSPYSLPPSEIEVDEKNIPVPTALQKEALTSLQQSRLDGHHKALIIMATGLGKTFLAAFDVLQYIENHSKKTHDQPIRICFLVHRQEILRQAADCFRTLFPYISFGFFMDNREDRDCDFLFASVQKLHRNLALFSSSFFDYIIIDEVHHAAAKTYRKILSHFQPDFLLGLTATPNRSDHEDISVLFDNHIPFVANLGQGIEQGLLTPFHYIGRIDNTDFQPIAMNGKHFEETELNQAICTEDRMNLVFELWNSHPAETTLIFCSNIQHADFVCSWLLDKGISIAAVHSGEHSAEREYAIDRLIFGELDALCVVDLFNEGIDIPNIDRILMLRPTSSSTIFLQQIGRGLRKYPDKEFVTILDLVGNHRVFLERLDTILSLGSQKTDIFQYIQGNKTAILPSGCRIELETAIIEMLQHFLPSNTNPSLQLYRQFKNIHTKRPKLQTILRLQIPKINLYGPLHNKDWFSFLEHEGDISRSEKLILQQVHQWFAMLEHTPMTKSFKMVAIHVLAIGDILEEQYGLIEGMNWEDFCRNCWIFLQQNPLLIRDIEDVLWEDWPRYWDKWISSSWEKDGQWLIRKKGKISTKLRLPKTYRSHLAYMSLEIIDARLYQYQQRKPLFQDFEASVTSIASKLALRLPTGKYREQIPIGSITCRLPTGDFWVFRLSKSACHVAHPLGSQQNQIRMLLERWFGEQAAKGHFRLRFSLIGDSWWVEPIGGLPPSFIDRTTLPLYERSNLTKDTANSVCLPCQDKEDRLLFAMRAWQEDPLLFPSPIRKDDWLVLRWHFEREKNHVYLLHDTINQSYLLRKLLQNKEGQFSLQDGQGQNETIDIEHFEIIAKLMYVVSPEELLPTVGTTLHEEDVAFCLGLSSRPKYGYSTVDGHCFLVEGQRSYKTTNNQHRYSRWSVQKENKKQIWTLTEICLGHT